MSKLIFQLSIGICKALVIQEFRRLSEKYGQPTNQDRDLLSPEETLSIGPTTTLKEVLLSDLEHDLLPGLRLQLAKISYLLRPIGLRMDVNSNIKQLLEIQPEIERTIDQVKLHIVYLCPEGILSSEPNRVDDQDLRQFKSYRLRSLRTQFSKATFDFIERTIECIKGSEFDIAQCSWKRELKTLNYTIVAIKMLVDPHPYYRTENNEEPTQKLVHQPVIKLANLATSLTKVSH
ncbi:hypothetical protein PSTG_03574 [Puccinia striiformis f. sp. tritici PST-78]|uniref:Uncharacterized protein n=1 Tax=Puccinia striiformis f. sp. tritici PST-78 TaxID=1165861 RepID=A0A0L0VVK6_9BASI|nr:hypothetical protein PSTG_03574 [Puccinia striiformis f. sp. tritici PST-78]